MTSPKSSYYMTHRPPKVTKKSYLPEWAKSSFVPHTLPLPNTAARNGRIWAVLSIQRAVSRARLHQGQCWQPGPRHILSFHFSASRHSLHEWQQCSEFRNNAASLPYQTVTCVGWTSLVSLTRYLWIPLEIKSNCRCKYTFMNRWSKTFFKWEALIIP